MISKLLKNRYLRESVNTLITNQYDADSYEYLTEQHDRISAKLSEYAFNVNESS